MSSGEGQTGESSCDCQSWLCFFFSSRRRHTRSLCDWSSDVCSSDLVVWSSETKPYRRLKGEFRRTKPRWINSQITDRYSIHFCPCPPGDRIGHSTTT